MATVTKPIALDESLHTTELTPRNLADVLAQALQMLNTTISGLNFINAVVVAELPSVGISTTTIYLVPSDDPQSENIYDEYINLDGTSAGWEKIGSTEIDLSNYYTKTETDTLLSGKADTSDIPTVNDGTLTIQQNGTSKGSFTANSASNVNVNIETPTADKKTATDQFNTADGGLLSKCQIDLVPVQSGSGDPYPAGGGKNKCDNTQTPINAYVNANGVVTASGNDRSVICKVFPNTQYTISYYRVRVATGSDDWQVGEYASIPSMGDSGVRSVHMNVSAEGLLKATITTQSTTEYLLIKIANINITNYSASVATLQVELGSTATDYAPYSNIRPISGHTEVELYNVGKNRLPLDISTIKSINTSGTWNGNVYTINGGTFEVLTDNANNVIGINVNGTFNATTTLVIIPNTSDNNFVGEILNCSDVANENQSISLQYFNGTTYVNYYILQNSTDNYTITNAGNKVQIMVRIASGQTVNNRVFKPMIRLATDTDTTFEPYLGHLYTVQIGSTVYGGYVDLVSGVMTVDREYVDLNSLTWTYRSDLQIFQTTDVGFDYSLDTSKVNISSCYLYNGIKTSGSGAVSVNPSFSLYTNNRYMWIRDTRYTDPTVFTNSLLGQKAVLYLATPLTIQLTPQQIEALVGQNNLSTPLSGQSIETNGVEYKELFTFADVKEYVDKKIPDAPTTDGTYTLQAVVSGGVPTYSWV